MVFIFTLSTKNKTLTFVLFDDIKKFFILIADPETSGGGRK